MMEHHVDSEKDLEALRPKAFREEGGLRPREELERSGVNNVGVRDAS